MSSVEFSVGIDGVRAGKETVDFKLVAPIDSALVGWLAEAQKAGTLVTVSITAIAEDDQAERQLRLFEDAMVTDYSPQRAAVGAAVADFRKKVRKTRGLKSMTISDSEGNSATIPGGDADSDPGEPDDPD